MSPLTRPHRDDPRLAERWDLVAFGAEIGTAYSELVDPVEQRARLTAQSLQAAGGDPEAMELDEDFLTALEYAMPPTGGLGMGMDRLVMMLTQTLDPRDHRLPAGPAPPQRPGRRPRMSQPATEFRTGHLWPSLSVLTAAHLQHLGALAADERAPRRSSTATCRSCRPPTSRTASSSAAGT